MFGSPDPVAFVVPVVPPTGRIPDPVDARLGALALAAQTGDAAARDAIHTALAPRLDVIVRSVFRRCAATSPDPAVELDDLRQEGYLVLVDLVEGWTGEATLCEHVLSRFHWRLRAAYADHGGSPRRGPSEPFEIVGAESVEAAGEADQTPLLLLTADLPERQRRIVLLRVGGGYRQRQVAEALGIARSTLAREWDRALATLREALRTG